MLEETKIYFKMTR